MSEQKLEEDDWESPQFRFQILEYVTKKQRENGLRHNDYMRYRQYCCRRLARVKKSLKVNNTRNYKKKLIPFQAIKSAKYISIPLINAERAWGYAMQLKQEMTNNPEEGDRKKFHLLRRLAKAAKHGDELVQLTSAIADTRTQLEAEAYAAFMHGTNLMERHGEQQEALEKLIHAKSVFEQLLPLSPESAYIFQDRISKLQPSIQYCKYVLGRQSGGSVAIDDNWSASSELSAKLQAMADESAAAAALEADSKSASNQSFSWQGEPLIVLNKKVQGLLIRADEMAESISSTSSSSLHSSSSNVTPASPNSKSAAKAREFEQADQFINMYQVVFNVVDEALQLSKNDAKLSEDATSKAQLELVLEYINFKKLQYTTRRNQLMVENMKERWTEQQNKTEKKGQSRKKVRARDLVVMFEKLSQNVDDLLLALDTSSTDQQVIAALDAQYMTYAAYRTYFLAEAYTAVGKNAEAYALFDMVPARIEEAVKNHGNVNQVDQAALDGLNELNKRAKVQLAISQAQHYLAQHQKQEEEDKRAEQRANKNNDGDDNDEIKEGKEATRYLLDRIEDFDAGSYRDGHDIIAVPPRFIPAPSKPTVFDLAGNNIEFNDISSKYEATLVEDEQQGGAGVLGKVGGAIGKVGGWFGWGSG